MKLTRIAAAASIALATTAVIGFATPAGASETPGDWTKLCVYSQNECLYAQGVGKAVKMAPDSGTMTNWLYPASGQIGQIKQANTNLCLEADETGANVIIEATCSGALSTQEWSLRQENPDLTFESRWNTTDCLTYNASGDSADLHGCTNVWYESWVPTTN
jgi:hypothetical protein